MEIAFNCPNARILLLTTGAQQLYLAATGRECVRLCGIPALPHNVETCVQ